MEQEKRMRREIANSNERRRMQSINAGFQSLRGLLPHHEGEKLSKAAILQQTAEYIYQLEQEKTKLMNANAQLKRLIAQNGESPGSSKEGGYSSPQSPAVDIPLPVAKRRKTLDGAVESADEGIGSMSPEHIGGSDEMVELKRENLELAMILERERRHRIDLEEHIVVLRKQNIQRQQKQQHSFSNEDNEMYSATGRIVQTPGQVIHETTPRCYTVRNNLETIVEAIRHLEGDHLFSDDCTESTSPETTSPCSASPPGAMEICNSPGSSPSHSQSMVDPLSPTSSLSSSPSQQHSGGSYPSSPPSTIVTSLKNHVLSRIARSSDADEQPINLEFRPGLSVTKSPPSFTNQQPIMQFQIQQQLRPGVIVVKHS